MLESCKRIFLTYYNLSQNESNAEVIGDENTDIES